MTLDSKTYASIHTKHTSHTGCGGHISHHRIMVVLLLYSPGPAKR